MFKRAVVSLTAVAALLAGASTSAQAATPGAKPAAKAWSRTDLLPVTQPVSVAGRFVAYTAAHGHLSLTVFDATTGRTLFSLPASFSGTTVGENKWVTFSGSTVFFYSPIGSFTGERAQLQAVDVRTGKVLWRQGAEELYLDLPRLCRVSPGLLCLDDWINGAFVALRVDASTGRQRAFPAAGGRAIGPGLVDTARRPDEVMERVDEVSAKVLWKLPLSALSPAAKVSTDHGWIWSLVGGVYVGWVGTVGTPFSLSTQMTFGVRASDGKVLWRRPGLYDCLNSAVSTAWSHLYACVGTGSFSHGKPVGVDVTLQGFDVHTGATTWSRHVGDAPATLGDGSPVVPVGPTSVAIPVVGGPPIGINLRTGGPAPTTVKKVSSRLAWCAQSADWKSADPIYIAGRAYRSFPRNGLVRPCTATGKTAAATTTMDRARGAVAHNVLVWAGLDGLHAVKLR